MAKAFLVISYDIGDDKRRTKVMKTLEDYGARVQYSVFECTLEAPQLLKLKKQLKLYVKAPEDSIRFYSISADDLKRIEIMGSGSVTRDSTFYLH
jgi:CRISPR-associated protein Cas2